MEEFLSSNSKTKCILRKYREVEGVSLKNDERTRLVDAIMTGLLDRHNAVKSHVFQELSEELEKNFPSECKLVYFCPKTGQALSPSGKLYVKYNNVTARRRSWEKTIKKKEVENPVNLDPGAAQVKSWLKISREPWSMVIDQWNKSYELRREDIKRKTTVEVLEEWPILKSAGGFLLVSIYLLVNVINKTSKLS